MVLEQARTMTLASKDRFGGYMLQSIKNGTCEKEEAQVNHIGIILNKMLHYTYISPLSLKING